MNLTVGVYHDAQGRLPILSCVKEAERRLIDAEHSKSYLRIEGQHRYDQRVPELLLGPDHSALTAGRTCTVQTPGGTGALRVAADWLAKLFPGARSGSAHPLGRIIPNVLRAAGRQLQSYATTTRPTTAVRVRSDDVRPGQRCRRAMSSCCTVVVIIQRAPIWTKTSGPSVLRCLQERQALPLIDFAYQGLPRGWNRCRGLRTVCDHVDELMVCSSFSKNFGLYRERVGALSVVTRTRTLPTPCSAA